MIKTVLAGATMLALAAFGSAHAGTVTVDFSGILDGAAVGTTYASEGLTFSPNAIVGTCDTGCPAPNVDGNFVYSSNGSPFTAYFASAQNSVAFQSVSFSSTLAQAFNSSGAVVSSLDDEEGYPATNALDTLSGPGITSIEFSYDNGYNGPAVTNLTFNASAVPEPGVWVMMLGGMGIIGGMLRVAQAQRREKNFAQAATA